MFFARICDHLTKPISSSPQHGSGIALSILSTMFNIVAPTSQARFHIFMAIIKVVKNAGSTGVSYDTIKPQLASLEDWLEEWNTDEDEQRHLFEEIAKVANASGETEEVYKWQIKALQTYGSDNAGDGRQLALQTLKMSLTIPTHFDFQDLTALDAIQALRKSDPEFFELLEIFTSDGLDELNDFKDEHDGWIEKQDGLDKAALDRKMRLLTLASLSASTGQTRQLSYESIAKALQIAEDEVEMWIIDVIRAGLVEGKLSQMDKQFLIHRSTYRVFGDNQWREIAARLDMWKTSLTSVLAMVRREKEGAKVAKELEGKDGEREVGQRGQDGGRGGFRGRGGRQDRGQNRDRDQQQQQQVPATAQEVEVD
jgi:translation initiation factor 3 subunit M